MALVWRDAPSLRLASMMAAREPSAAIEQPKLASRVELPLATRRRESSVSVARVSGEITKAVRRPGATRLERLSMRKDRSGASVV